MGTYDRIKSIVRNPLTGYTHRKVICNPPWEIPPNERYVTTPFDAFYRNGIVESSGYNNNKGGR